MDEVKPKQDLADIVDVVELSVKILALEELAELIEDQ